MLKRSFPSVRFSLTNSNFSVLWLDAIHFQIKLLIIITARAKVVLQAQRHKQQFAFADPRYESLRLVIAGLQRKTLCRSGSRAAEFSVHILSHFPLLCPRYFPCQPFPFYSRSFLIGGELLWAALRLIFPWFLSYVWVCVIFISPPLLRFGLLFFCLCTQHNKLI